MRKTSIVILCIAFCTTMILPAFAKKGGGQSPTTVTLSGDVDYNGPAKIHDVETYFSLTIGAEGKKKTIQPLKYNTKWPGAFYDATMDTPKSFFSIYCWKDGSLDAKVTCSLDESYVVKAYGKYSRTINEEGKTEITVTIDDSEGGYFEYFEIKKREGLVQVVPPPPADLPIIFTVTF